MPASVIAEPLGISCSFSDGGHKTFSLNADQATALARDLLTGLTQLVHPHGKIDRPLTARTYLLAICRIVKALSSQGFTGGAAQLRRGMLAQYWMAGTRVDERCTRRLLLAFHELTGGLSDEVRAHAEGRSFHRSPRTEPLAPYSESEWQRLTSASRSVIDASFRAHQIALSNADTGSDPAIAGCASENWHWLFAQQGPMATEEVAAHLGIGLSALHKRGGGQERITAMTDLFPTPPVTLAYRLLFGAYTGIVPDGIDELGLGDIDWAGDHTVLLSYVKDRTAAESLTLPVKAVRLLRQWLEHSALMRQFAPADGRQALWLRANPSNGHRLIWQRFPSISVARWVARHGLTADTGGPLSLDRHRIRTTFAASRDRRFWSGSARATIDPNRSAAVEGDHYLSVGSVAQQHALDEVIESAQHDMLRRAQPPTILGQPEVVTLLRDYPKLVAELQLDDQTMVELVGGRRDVFVAACADQLAGLHGPKGQPCPARPWVCLLCPLAVFAPRHAANLLRLKAFFTRQWQQMPAAHFMAVFGPYATRIDEVLARYDTTVLALAAARAAEHEEGLPLRAEEATS